MGVIVRTADEFAAAVDAWAQQIKPAVIDAQKEVVQAAFVAMTDIAPRWTGRFVGSINVAAGSPDAAVLPVHPDVESGQIHWPTPPANPYDAKTVEEAMAALGAMQAFEVVYLTDAVPYAGRLDMGYSSQAPQGVTEVSKGIVVSQFAPGYSWRFLADQAAGGIPF